MFLSDYWRLDNALRWNDSFVPVLGRPRLANILEIQNIVNIGSTETIDTLGIVSHYTDLLSFFGQLQTRYIVGHIGILILVYQHTY